MLNNDLLQALMKQKQAMGGMQGAQQPMMGQGAPAPLMQAMAAQQQPQQMAPIAPKPMPGPQKIGPRGY